MVSIARSSHYYAGKGESALNLKLMRLIDEQFSDHAVVRVATDGALPAATGLRCRRKRIRRLMRQMGLAPIYRKPRTSTPHPAHRIYPYLLRHVRIDRPNQVWCADITYIPMQRGFQYLVAIMDWATRTVLSWRLSNTLDSDFCTEALEEALAKYKRPKIFNTDQGSQFTSQEFTEVLKNEPGSGSRWTARARWMDNIFTERLWRSLKYECVYLHDFEDGPQARQTIGTWIRYYNEERPHSTHADDRTPMEEYARRRAA